MSQGLVQYDEEDDAGTVHTITGTGIGVGAGQINWSGGFGGVPIGNLPSIQAGQTVPGVPGLSYSNMGFGTVTLAAVQKPKTDVVYVIVDKLGKCMELEERKMMSPREIINVCKFLSVVAAVQNNGTKIHWTELVENLGITNQFVEGKASAGQYVTSEEILYVFLID